MFEEEEKNSPAAEGQSNAHRFGKCTVFERKYNRKDGSGAFILYDVSHFEGKNEEGEPQYSYLRVPQEQSFGKQVVLTPEQAKDLADGEELVIELRNRDDSVSQASLFISAVDEKVETGKDGKEYLNRTAKTTTARHIIGQDGTHKGYSFFMGDRNVTTFHTVGNVRLGAADCFDLVEGRDVAIDGEIFSPGELVRNEKATGKTPTFQQKIVSSRLNRAKGVSV